MNYLKILLLLAITGIAYSQSSLDKFRELVKNRDYNEAVKLASQVSSENTKNIDAHLDIAIAYLELEDDANAYIYAKKAYDLDDDAAKVLRIIGRVTSIQSVKIEAKGNQAEALKKAKEAEKLLKEAVDEDKKDVTNYLELADHYIRIKNLKDSELWIGRAKKIAPQDARVEIANGDMYFEQGVYELSKNAYNSALSLDPNLLTARERLAESYNWLGARESDADLKNEYYKSSLDEWYNVAKVDPLNPKANFNIGKILFFSQRYKDALPPLYNYQKLKPDGATGRWFLGQCFYELNLPDSSISHFEYAEKNLDSVKYKAGVILARTYYEAKKYQESINKYQSIFASNDANYDSVLAFSDRIKYGQAFLMIKDTNKTLDVYEELINKYPSNSCELVYKTAQLALVGKKYDRAIKFFELRLANQNCKNEGKDSLESSIRYYLGTANLYLNKPDLAIENYNKSLLLDSKQPNILLNLAECYVQKSQNDTAKTYYRKYIDLGKANPTSVNKNQLFTCFNKTFVIDFQTKKDFPTAKALCTEWAELFPENSQVFFFLGLTNQALKDKKSACEAYTKAVELDPKNEKAIKFKEDLKCK
jgi:tetratricopeptide (TPR) repeat protein